MSLAPATFEEAKEAFKPMRRTPMPRSGGKTRAASARARRKPKRKRVATRKSLIKKIDRLVFQIVCLRDPVCVECHSKEKPTTGHVLSRRSFATRWDFRNVYRQCWPCNYKAAMTAAASYHLWFVKQFGVDAFDALYRDWAKGHKYTRLELEGVLREMTDEFTSRSSKSPSELCM